MKEGSLLESLGQVSASQTGQVFRDFLSGHVREMICEFMAAEVTELCGPKHHPSQDDQSHAGSSPDRVLYEGQREEVMRLRVRQRTADGSSQEVELSSYIAAKDPRQLQQQIVQAIVSGVSSRGNKEIKPSYPGVKKSNVSRLWQEAGSRFVEKLRGKHFCKVQWCGLMLDCIRLSKDQTVVVALGIEPTGSSVDGDSQAASRAWANHSR